MTQLDHTEVSPQALWVLDAREILREITDGMDITSRYLDVEKEAMPTILQTVERMIEHLGTIPQPCKCEDEGCPAFDIGYGYAPQEGDMSWITENILGMDGKPVVFEVLAENFTIRKTCLTREEYVTLLALKLIVGDHAHDIKLTLR